MDSPLIQRLNITLANKYGRNLRGEPLFRVVFSDDQREKRLGTFNEFYGDIFLRSVTEVREVPKYPTYKRIWIIERWIAPSLAYNAEIPSTREGSYEPLYAFIGPAGEALTVFEDFVLYVCYLSLNPNLPGHMASLDRTQEEDKEKKEIEYNLEILEDAGRSWIGHRLHSREGITVPENVVSDK